MMYTSYRKTAIADGFNCVEDVKLASSPAAFSESIEDFINTVGIATTILGDNLSALSIQVLDETLPLMEAIPVAVVWMNNYLNSELEELESYESVLEHELG